MTDHQPNTKEDVQALVNNATDRSLVRRFREGQDDAATALYVRYAQRLQNLANGMTGSEIAVRADPEGIVQSVFRTFFRRAAGGQYDMADSDDLWKLFLVIALNKIRSTAVHHRAQKRDVSRTDAFHDQLSNTSEKCSDESALSVLRLTVDELLAPLPQVQRNMVLLRIEGHDVAYIAEKSGRSKRSVERILQRFRASLRAELDQGD